MLTLQIEKFDDTLDVCETLQEEYQIQKWNGTRTKSDVLFYWWMMATAGVMSLGLIGFMVMDEIARKTNRSK